MPWPFVARFVRSASEQKLEAADRPRGPGGPIQQGGSPRSDLGSPPGAARSPAATRGAARPPLLICVVFLLSRAVFFALGVRFDYAINDLWFLDVAHLTGALWQSLFYLHAQPPLYNLFLGVVLRLFGDNAPYAVHGIYILLGLGATLSIYGVLRLLQVPAAASVLAALVYGLGPTAILYENLLNHTYAVASIFVMSAYAFGRFLATPRWRHVGLFFLLALMLALLRSAYHPLWLVLLAAFATLARPREWRKIAVAASLPLVLVFGIMAKNQVLFSSFATSSWLGINIMRMAAPSTQPPEFRRDLAERRIISPRTVDRGWKPDLRRDFPELADGFLGRRPTGIPVLDECLKSTRRPNDPPHLRRNYNCIDYLLVSKQEMKDAIELIQRRPQDYLRSIVWAVQHFFDSPVDYFRIAEANRAALGPYVDAFEFAVYGMVPAGLAEAIPIPDRFKDRIAETGIWVLVAVVAIGCFTTYSGLALLRARWRREAAPDGGTLMFLFLGLNVSFFFFVFNAFEVGENNRFRVDIEPLIFCAAVYLLSELPRVKAVSFRGSTERIVP